MKRTVLRKRWGSGESAGGQVVQSELCTTAPGGLLSRDFHAVSFTEFHLDSGGAQQPLACLWHRGRWELPLADETPAVRVSDQVIRENPANRGTETSAEVLVGPPWRMESNAGK